MYPLLRLGHRISQDSRLPRFGKFWMVYAAIALGLATGPAQAAVIHFGVVSYDVVTPEDGPQLGVNAINLQNFTGGFALPADFPITTALTITGLSVTIYSPGGSQVVDLGDFGPGSFALIPELQFASNSLLNSISLSGSVGPSVVSLSTGGTATLGSSAFQYVLAPSTGETLQAGIDLGVLDVETVSDVPELGTGLMAIAGLVSALSLRRRGRA